MKKYIWRIILGINLFAWFFTASMDVGSLKACAAGDVYPWTLPWMVLLAFGATAVTGIAAGMEWEYHR